MSQPKVTTEQIDNGAGPSQLLTVGSFQTAGSGRSYQSLTGTISPASGATIIPLSASAPLITGGTQIGTASFTPTASTAKVLIDFGVTLDASAANTIIIVAVFRNSTCISSSVVTIDTNGRPKTHTLTFVDSPATTSAVTYSGRVGVSTAGPTWYVNSVSTGNNLGGTLTTSFTLTELS